MDILSLKNEEIRRALNLNPEDKIIKNAGSLVVSLVKVNPENGDQEVVTIKSYSVDRVRKAILKVRGNKVNKKDPFVRIEPTPITEQYLKDVSKVPTIPTDEEFRKGLRNFKEDVETKVEELTIEGNKILSKVLKGNKIDD